jgi:hypothetical protein
MALAANVVLEVRTTGSDTNGGGWVPGSSGTDWSQQNGAQYSVTDGVTAGTTTITSATANFGTDVVGNLIYVQGGTGSITAGWYQIISRTNSTTIVVDRSTGLSVGTGATLKIGGALATPGIASAVLGSLSGNWTVFMKSGTYTLSTTTANASGGPVSLAAGGSSQTVNAHWVSYDTTRSRGNTDANKASIVVPASGVSSITVFLVSGNVLWVEGIIVDGASKTSITGFGTAAAGSNQQFYRCKAANCTNSGFSFTRTGNTAILCEATGCATAGAAFNGTMSDGYFAYCSAYSNSVPGFTVNTSNVMYCLAYSNSGGSSYGFGHGAGNSGAGIYLACIAYNNGASGFSLGGSNSRTVLINCVATQNAANGFLTNSGTLNFLLYCAGYSNTSGNISGFDSTVQVGFVTLTGDPWTNAAGGVFTTNTTSGAGAALRAAGFPAALFPASAGTSYADIGLLQHQDAGGGTSVFLGPI